MAEDKKDSKEEIVDDGSLENPSTQEVKEDSLDSNSGADEAQSDNEVKIKVPIYQKIFALSHGINIYLIMFIAIVALAIVVTFVALNANDPNETDIQLTGQELDQEAIDDLLQTDTQVGDVSQTLTVEANAVFNGKVLVKDNLDVAGSINVGGPLTLPGITVSGTSQFDDVAVNNNLSILGNVSAQGTFNASSLNVDGDGSFGGSLTAASITVENIQFTGNVELLRHIDTGGPTPGVSSGAGIGSGGTVSISGTDTAGTVTINTGAGPAPGILANISFVNAFGRTPHVQITPVGQPTGNLGFYVTRSSSTFSIGSATAPSGATTYTFDYFVLE